MLGSGALQGHVAQQHENCEQSTWRALLLTAHKHKPLGQNMKRLLAKPVGANSTPQELILSLPTCHRSTSRPASLKY